MMSFGCLSAQFRQRRNLPFERLQPCTRSTSASLTSISSNVMGREYLSTTDELKKQLRALQTKKSNIEKELLAFVEALPPNAGMDAPLVDREGFPRSDVDVTLVRQLRQKIIMLRNDEKALTEEISEKLQEYFREVKSRPQSSHTPLTVPSASSQGVLTSDRDTEQRGGTANQQYATPRRLFALVDQIASGSPASEGGLMQGDQVLQFGGVTSDLPTLAKCIQESEGQTLGVEVLRRGTVIRLQVTPKRWSGRGLLGANLLPS